MEKLFKPALILMFLLIVSGAIGQGVISMGNFSTDTEVLIARLFTIIPLGVFAYFVVKSRGKMSERS